MRKRLCFLLFLLLIPSQAFALLDLNKLRSPFVLETKKITIPECPQAFNASIIRWMGSLLMSFRYYNKRVPRDEAIHKIGLVWLNDNFEPKSPVQTLDFPKGLSQIRPHDPRLIQVEDKLFMVYSDVIYSQKEPSMRRVFVARLLFEENQFFLSDIHCLKEFEGSRENLAEKNWSPFECEGNLLYIYRIAPHKILKLKEGTDFCETVACSENSIDWRFGEPRGGTPALLIGEEYLSFFHSSMALKTVQSGGKELKHYFMGAYTFSRKYPFVVTHISPNPIIGKGFYDTTKYTALFPNRVVFPCGFIEEGPFIWVVYGRQDIEIWAAKLDKERLLQSLIPVSTME